MVEFSSLDLILMYGIGCLAMVLIVFIVYGLPMILFYLDNRREHRFSKSSSGNKRNHSRTKHPVKKKRK